jgi:hypothetical protein
VLGCTHVDARSVRGADLESFGEHGCGRARRHRDRETRVKTIVFRGCHESLRQEETNAGQPWGRE